MAQIPEAFGMSVTIDDMAAARHFYEALYPHDSISEGVFAGSTPSGHTSGGSGSLAGACSSPPTPAPAPARYSPSALTRTATSS